MYNIFIIYEIIKRMEYVQEKKNHNFKNWLKSKFYLELFSNLFSCYIKQSIDKIIRFNCYLKKEI